MSEKELDLDDITSLLNTIDDLVSVSGNKDDITARTSSLSKIKTEELKDQGFLDAQLEEIAKGIEQGLSVDVYAQSCYNWMQMYEMRMGLLAHLDTSKYESPLFSASQMREIRLGLLDHLDVSSYATLILSSTDMRKIRHVLFSTAYKANPTGFGRTMTDEETGITLRISDDCMKAFIRIPPTLQTELTEDDLMEMLKSHEIVHGIIQENLQKLIGKKPATTEICIAQGRKPTPGMDGWYELFFENCIERGHTVPPDGEIDYTDVNTVDAVEAETVLAKYHPAQKAPEGITVTGITLEANSGHDLPTLTGVGFRRDLEQNTYIATTRGCISYNEAAGSLNVWNVYRIQGDVCYYQSLDYDGIVHVSGSVRDKSTIRAKGDIIIDGFVESANVYSEQNVVIKGGANGGGHGRIEAGGSIRGNFFENIDVSAKGLIEGNYFFNTNIETEDRLVARGKKARIIGGNITAAVSVDAVIVGNYLSNKTVFNVGDINSFNKRITVINVQKKKIMEELQQLVMGKQKLLLLLGEEQANGNTLYTKTCDAIYTKELQADECDREINRLKQVIKRAEKAYIKIHGKLQSDVIFIINNNKKKTSTPMNQSVLLTGEDCKKRK